MPQNSSATPCTGKRTPCSEMPDKLPRGIFYEPHRNRYRVRLYYCQQVVWRSYHDELASALAELHKAHDHRRRFVRQLVNRPKKEPPRTLKDLLS